MTQEYTSERGSSIVDASAVPAASQLIGKYVTFVLVVSLYLLPFMRVMLPESNEGTILSGAARIVHGDVFARDFFEVMGPGSFYIVALFFKVFGVTFLAARLWLFCSSLGVALSTYFLSRRVCPRNPLLPSLILAGTWFGMQWPSVSHHVDSDLFALLSVVSLVVWDERRHPVMLYLAGILAGMTLWIHQPKGALLIVALLIWCNYRRVPGTSRVFTLARFCLGLGAVSLGGCGYFASEGALRSLAYANVTWPAQNYGTVNRVPYALGLLDEYWHHWAALHGTVAGWPVALATFLIIPFVFVASIPVLFLLSLRGVSSCSASPSALLCVLAGWALWLSEIHRMDVYHLAFGCPLLLGVCIGVMGNCDLRVARISLQLAAISAACLATLNLLQTVTAQTVDTRVGTVGLLKAEPLLQFLNAHTRAGEDVFFYPYCPGYYFLSATNNPTRFSILVYDYNTSAEFHDAVRTLDEAHVRIVVWDSTFRERRFRTVFPGIESTSARPEIVEPYLDSRYRQIGNVDGFRILLRNE